MRFDIVIPAHNEEHRIDRTLQAYRSRCTDPEFRFLVALDHCTDRTARVVADHAVEDRRVDALEFPKLGKGGVLIETFRRCAGDVIGFVDADCATPPIELLRLLDVARHRDVAIASRRHAASVVPGRRPLLRRLTSAGFAFGIQRLFRLPFTDPQCGAKAMRRDVVEQCLPYISSRDFLFDVDLLVVAGQLGFDVAEVPTVWIDQPGSRLHPVRDTWRMAASSLRLWLHHRLLPVDAEPGSELPTAAAAAESDHTVIELREGERASA